MIERRDSSDSFAALIEKENDPNYEIKIFPKPSNQNMLTKSKGRDKTMAEVLVRTRHKMHQYCGHVFNDRAFKLDIPKVGLGRNSGDWKANQRSSEEERKGRFRLGPMATDDADESDNAEEEQLYLSARKDEYNRLLHLSRYARPNPLVSSAHHQENCADARCVYFPVCCVSILVSCFLCGFSSSDDCKAQYKY
jgi:hypothetical protein